MRNTVIRLCLAGWLFLTAASCSGPQTAFTTATATVAVTEAPRTVTMVITVAPPPKMSVPPTMTFPLPTITVKPATTTAKPAATTPKPPVTTLLPTTSLAPTTTAARPGRLLPDLWVLEPFQLFIMRDPATGNRWLFFDTTVVNSGEGALELRGAYDEDRGETRAVQRIFNSQGGYEDTLAGYFIYHPMHDHWHFEGFSVFEIYSVDAAGAPVALAASSEKQSFCIIDTARLITPPPNSPAEPVYPECDPVVQGISVGWADIYDITLPGQQINIQDLPDGRYMIKMTVDPEGRILETDETDNETFFYVEITGTRIVAIPGP